MEKNKLKGLSLARCVKDIILGKVSISQIDHIETDTDVRGPDGWKRLAERYNLKEWKFNPKIAWEVLMELLRLDLIKQPRKEGKPAPKKPRPHQHWLCLQNDDQENK